MLPTVGSDSLKIIRYAAEVAGRTLGIAAMANLVPDAARRAALETSGNLINTAAQQLVGAYFAPPSPPLRRRSAPLCPTAAPATPTIAPSSPTGPKSSPPRR